LLQSEIVGDPHPKGRARLWVLACFTVALKHQTDQFGLAMRSGLLENPGKMVPAGAEAARCHNGFTP
jgi:hypothetical protein